MVSLTFDARTVEPSAGFEPVPAGWYNVMVDDTEMRPTKKADGAYLNVRFNILDGQHANQKIFQRLNLQNPSVAAKEIAFKQLSALCHAVGVLMLNDSGELHGKPLKVKVKIRKDEEYGDSNDITSIKNINEPTPGAKDNLGVPVAPAPATAPAPQGWGTPAPAPVAAADPYQYTPDGKQRWKTGMPAWELVPTAPPAAPQTGWTPPATAQPWTAPAAPPAAAPTPPAAAAPPWQQPRA